MHGNVYEWVNDWSGTYNLSQNLNSTGPSTGTQRALRGGSWGAYASHSTSRYRVSNAPSVNNRYLGFRVVRIP